MTKFNVYQFKRKNKNVGRPIKIKSSSKWQKRNYDMSIRSSPKTKGNKLVYKKTVTTTGNKKSAYSKKTKRFYNRLRYL